MSCCQFLAMKTLDDNKTLLLFHDCPIFMRILHNLKQLLKLIDRIKTFAEKSDINN